MKKRIASVLLAILLLIPTTIEAKAKKETGIPSPQSVQVNGEKVKLRGYNIADYNYFKLRDLAATLSSYGLNFSIDGDDKEIHIYEGKEYVKQKNDLATIGEKKKQALGKNMQVHFHKSEETLTREISLYNIEGYNYFKLRDMGDILSFAVDYDEKNNVANIETISSAVDLTGSVESTSGNVTLGNERLLSEFSSLIDGKKVGVVTNQTGVNSNGESVVKILQNYGKTTVVAAYSPEHGLDGKAKAGAYVESYHDTTYNIPVYSLYGKTRKPSKEMVKDIDVFIYDMQDIGSRTYTYISTLNYVMEAAKEFGKEVVVLDRPNPVGGNIVEGFTLKEKYKTFVGVDEMPMAHGMTVGELAKFFNRKIGCTVTVVPMKGWSRNMIWQDTGLPWVQTSPNIPTIESAFHYMATGIGDGTGIGQADKFHWVGGKGINSKDFAEKMNAYNLPGIHFVAEDKGTRGGVKLEVTDFHQYNPAKTGTYLLATANLMTNITVPAESSGTIPMFEKIMGSDSFGNALRSKLTPEEIEEQYRGDVEKFKVDRTPYLIY